MRTSKVFWIFILIILLVNLYIIINSTFHKKTISMATGSKSGAYYQYALSYKEIFASEGIHLKIIPTNGSLEAQSMLLNKEVDFAFIQGGTEKAGILGLANIAYEPIWIFYKDQQLSSLKMLEGKRVAIGKEDSGIYPIANELLTTLNINVNSKTFQKIQSKRAVQRLKQGRLDAMIYVGSDKSSIVNELMMMEDIHLMDFEYADAYQQYSLRENEYYECLTLKKAGFHYQKHIPNKSHLMLAKTTMVGTISASDEMVRLMLKVIDKVHKKAGIFHDENTFPNTNNMKLLQHEASVEYFDKPETFLEKNVDYWTAQTMQGLYTFILFFFLPLITVFAFVVEVIIPAYMHYSRLQINKWYYQVNNIDTGLESLTQEEIESKIVDLNILLTEIRENDDIPAIHMGPFYTLQNQIVSLIDDLERRR